MRTLWIDGQKITPNHKPHRALDPATEQNFAEFSWEIRRSRSRHYCCKKAFPGWRRFTTNERAAMLHEVAQRLRKKSEELSAELSLETGRSIVKNRGYVEWSAQCFDYYAELARHSRGRVIPSPEASQLSLVIKEPIGVDRSHHSLNYPLLLLVWKLAPALAAGNTVVIKPATYTSWVSLGFASLFDHLPPGVVNIITGSGQEVGEILCRASRCTHDCLYRKQKHTSSWAANHAPGSSMMSNTYTWNWAVKTP